jgi:hypothetical protein
MQDRAEINARSQTHKVHHHTLFARLMLTIFAMLHVVSHEFGIECFTFVSVTIQKVSYLSKE